MSFCKQYVMLTCQTCCFYPDSVWFVVTSGSSCLNAAEVCQALTWLLGALTISRRDVKRCCLQAAKLPMWPMCRGCQAFWWPYGKQPQKNSRDGKHCCLQAANVDSFSYAVTTPFGPPPQCRLHVQCSKAASKRLLLNCILWAACQARCHDSAWAQALCICMLVLLPPGSEGSLPGDQACSSLRPFQEIEQQQQACL